MALLSPLAVAEPQARIVGGPGGTPFADQAPPVMRLVAVAVRSGEAIDAIAAVLRRPNGERFPVPSHGGPGGSAGAFVLREGESLTALNVWAGQFVDAIQSKPISGNRTSTAGRTERRNASPSRRVTMPWASSAGQSSISMRGLALQPGELGSQASVGAQSPPADTATPTLPRKPMKPIAPTASARVLLDGPVNVAQFGSTSSSLTIRVRLKGPAPLTVNLGAQRPRAGTCFATGERIVATQTSPQAQIEHMVRFSGFSEGSRYVYSIPVDGGRCETGSASTATCLRTPDPKDNRPC